MAKKILSDWAISSQAAWEQVEGSTTRPRSPERTVKAHECAAPHAGEDIVWTALKDAEVGHKQAGGNIDCYNISPIDSSVVSMSKTIRATGKLHEWSQDDLNCPGPNAQLEGAAAGMDESKPIVELSNYCQIMSKVAEVTGTLEKVDKYGRDSEMAYQLELRYGELANDQEWAVVGTQQAKDAGSANALTSDPTCYPKDGITPQIPPFPDPEGVVTGARMMESFVPQLDDDVVIDASGAADIEGVENALLEAHLATYMKGGNPSYLVTDPKTAGIVSSFALAAGRHRDIRNERKLVNVIDLYVSTYGELDVVLDRNMEKGTMLLVDFNYTATPVLRPTADWPIAKMGDSDKRQILWEGTFAVLNTGAHAAVTGVDLTTP